MPADENSTILRADTEDAARGCFPVFALLRPHLDEATFLERWGVQRSGGYEIVYIERSGTVVAAAGFRELTTMAWGKILYLDDLIAEPQSRGLGLGTTLLKYLQAEVVRRGAEAMHLDTGYARHDAHRSYLRNGFDMICHHMEWRTT